MDVPSIRTERLDLVSMTPEFMETVLAGRRTEAEKAIGAALPAEPIDAAAARFLSHRIGQLRRDPDVQRWLTRAIVLREPARCLVGNVGFHGPPGVNAASGVHALEIGYGVLPEHRQQGYATEAVEALIAWARTQGHRSLRRIRRSRQRALARDHSQARLRPNRATHRSGGRSRACLRAARLRRHRPRSLW